MSLPAASEIRDMAKNEVVMSVVIGWLADLLTVISRILDAPLRYPLHLQVSLQQNGLGGQSFNTLLVRVVEKDHKMAITKITKSS